jgi:hypothetical protein
VVLAEGVKNIFLISAFILVLVAGLGFSIYFGVKPRPIPKIKLSAIESPEILANAVANRMSEEFKATKIYAFGFQPEMPHHLDVIKHWYDLKIADVWIVESKLQVKPEFISGISLDSHEQYQQIVEVIKKALAENKKVALVLPNIFSSQQVDNNLVSSLIKNEKIEVTSFSLVELIRNREDEKSAWIKCSVTPVDQTGYGHLGCSILQQARNLYRKKTDPNKKSAYMDQRGAFDYLIFYSR